MKRNISWVIFTLAALLLGACSVFLRPSGFGPQGEPRLEGPPTASNGERIYFTATSGRGTRVGYRGGPNFGGMMMALKHARIPKEDKALIAGGNLERIIEEAQL